MKKRTVYLLLICVPGLVAVLWFCWPRDAEYYFNRGEERFAYQDEDGNDDLPGALTDFNRVIRLHPQFAAAYTYRGRIKEINGDLDGALADFNRAIELDPKDARNFSQRGWFWERKADFNRAIADLDRAIELDSKDEIFLSRRAFLKRKNGDFSGMVMDLARAAEIFPPAPASQLRWMDRLALDGKPMRKLSRLILIYNRAIEEDPNFYQGYYHRGVLKQLSDDLDGALADFQQCAEFPDSRLKDYAAIHIWLVRTQKGETNEANLELSAYLDTHTNGTPRNWEVQIAKFLLDQISEADFSAAVGTTNEECERSQFWYYAAMKQLLAGDKVKAADYFRKSRSTETRPYAVAISSQIELSALGQ